MFILDHLGAQKDVSRVTSKKCWATTGGTIDSGLGVKNDSQTVQKHVEKIIRVTENEIISSLRLIWERLKIVCEPSCAVALAALVREKQNFKNKKIGIIISGGNVDLSKLPF